MGITLSPDQQAAAAMIKAWHEKRANQRFILAGLAGVGKSTIIESVIESLGIKPNEVAFCAYTGKAAMVLRQKGCPATTIHSLIYDMKEGKDGEPEFVLKDYIPKQIKLIVVDEASMVAKEMQEDLESYGKPILYIGDHGQLPPVGDSFATLMQHPDTRLEKIHRQAEGNPLIQAAMMARSGQRLATGILENEQGSFIKIPRAFIKDSHLMAADQVLCGKNTTRTNLNQRIRNLLGFQSASPLPSDRVICLRNKSKNGLINGMQGVFKIIEACEVNGRDGYLVHFEDEEGNTYQDTTNAGNSIWLPTNRGPKDDRFKAIRVQAGPFHGEKVDMKDTTLWPFDFSYAITVHKSQGSQYNSVLIYEEYLGDPEMHKRWLYTAITRGIKNVILVSPK